MKSGEKRGENRIIPPKTGERRMVHDKRLVGRTTVILLADIFTIALSYFFTLWARFDFRAGDIDPPMVPWLLKFLPIAIATYLLVYYLCHLYKSLWIFAGAGEALRSVLAYVIIVPATILEGILLHAYLPRSIYLFGPVMAFLFCLAIRLSFRVVRYAKHRRRRLKAGDKFVMIIGAGTAGRQILREYGINASAYGIVRCFIDDDPRKIGRYIGSCRIVGGREEIPAAVRQYAIDQIVYAIPSADDKTRREILNICKSTGCRISILPSMTRYLNGEASVHDLRDVEITDLLGRDEIKVNLEEIDQALRGKNVLVTGGGGSIGSELCRQIAAAQPGQLTILDCNENNAFYIQQELKRTYPELNLVTLIGSVRDTDRISQIFGEVKPDVVYHAAAHKHVPLMEDSPNEAVKNNVLGTANTAKAAAKAGVKKFVLISTDKAVNPTNVMGTTKRICEMIIQMMARRYPQTCFSAVRFGNVLGSSGSVIPLFKKQIAAGGPVTVTDPRVIRYFMTIKEAVSLVLQASYYAKGGEIFVLDMGEPVRIDDMARLLIELSGYVPDVDIEIRYIGLRPGEKLYEELLMAVEGMEKTANNRIFIGQPIEMDDEETEENILELEKRAMGNAADIRELLKRIVPTYHEEAQPSPAESDIESL